LTADALRRRGCRIQHPFGFIFIETKVWISDYGYDQTLHAFDKSTAKLGTGRLDLLILHQPLPSAFDRTIGAYTALERLLADGKVRAIGVSNFMPEHLNRLLEAIDIVPAVNQVELHPYFTQPGVQKADAEHGILTQAWSPIGGITFYRGSAKSTLARPGHPRYHQRPRQDRSPGDAALAPPARPLGHP
jgi:diketogulonate reductase-like aldo/keto reductase